MTALELIRLFAVEYADIEDETIEKWVEAIKPNVSKKQFGNLYETALAYYTCHKMKMAGYGDNPLGELGGIGVGFALNSVSEGGSSISFGAGQSSNLSVDAELALTSYGLQFLQLRRTVIVPIHISGENGDE